MENLIIHGKGGNLPEYIVCEEFPEFFKELTSGEIIVKHRYIDTFTGSCGIMAASGGFARVNENEIGVIFQGFDTDKIAKHIQGLAVIAKSDYARYKSFIEAKDMAQRQLNESNQQLGDSILSKYGKK